MTFRAAALVLVWVAWIGLACATSSSPTQGEGAPPSSQPSESAESKPPGAAPSPGFTICKEPRPEICTREYVPVCAHRNDGSLYTAGNACSACSDAQTLGHRPGACREPVQR